MNFIKLISFKTLRSLCTDFIIFLIPLILIFMAFPFFIKIMSPFIAGFVLYLAANPLNKFLSKRGLPPFLSALLSLLIISALVFFFIRAVIIKMLVELTALSENVGFISNSNLSHMSQKASTFIKHSDLPAVIKNSTQSVLPSLFENARNYLLKIAEKFTSLFIQLLKNIPSMLIWIFTSVFTTYFLLKEEDGIVSFSEKFFGKRVCSIFARTKKSFLSVTFSYIKAQMIIESIIFIILFTGFLILGMDYAFLTAFITAIVDAVPILGTGTVLIPMAIINFIMGSRSLAWGLLILYGVALLTRQLCEPKIIGNKLGIHPLATVFAMYSGMKLMGIAGLILGPILAIFIKNLVNTEKT